jgi:predicted HicB family RNase H-like nuclease
MKLRPQFNLRFRDIAQFELVMDEAQRDDISMNEWILRILESGSDELHSQKVMREKNTNSNT